MNIPPDLIFNEYSSMFHNRTKKLSKKTRQLASLYKAKTEAQLHLYYLPKGYNSDSAKEKESLGSHK
jgi:hypothetical protein